MIKLQSKRVWKLSIIFSVFSGLVLNKGKTVAMWLGPWRHCSEQAFGLRWRTTANCLGIEFSSSCCASEVDENWNSKLCRMKNLLSSWSSRHLSLLGKITVLKSLVASQLPYCFGALIPPETFVKEVNLMFFRFIWKRDRVKRNLMIQDYSNGGLKMIDIRIMYKCCLL